MSAGNIETDSFIIAGPCTSTSAAKSDSPICTSFCRSGDCSTSASSLSNPSHRWFLYFVFWDCIPNPCCDCSNCEKLLLSILGKEVSVYSYAIPGQGLTQGFQPSQVVNSLYQISIENPTIVGLSGNASIYILACRDSTCADYNQQLYKDGFTFGRSVAATLTKSSSLAILYSKLDTQTGEYELVLDVCKDPVCDLKGTSTSIAKLTTEPDLWLGYDVNTNTPIIIVSDSHAQTITSYTCTATLACTPSKPALVDAPTNAYAISPYQLAATKKPKKPLTTAAFFLAYALVSPKNRTSSVIAMACSADLKACNPSELNIVPQIDKPILALSVLATGPNTFQLGVGTFDGITNSIGVYNFACTLGQVCTDMTSGNVSLGFAPDFEHFELDVAVLSSPDTGSSTFIQAANNLRSNLNPATELYGLKKGAFFQVKPSKYLLAKYHKPPPSVFIGLMVLTGVAVVSTILLIIWRVWAGAPPKIGYTRIN